MVGATDRSQQNDGVRRPTLVVVTGRPGSGKTTLSRAMAGAMRCPTVSRDDLKEGLLFTGARYGATGGDVDWRVYAAFFETIDCMLNHGVTVLAEAAFQHALWAPKLEALQNCAMVRIVVCEVSPRLAYERIVERADRDPARARYHRDASVTVSQVYEVPRLAVPILGVDTTDGYRPGFDVIVGFASGVG
jgi:predicted kinase